jgi:zinc protease
LKRLLLASLLLLPLLSCSTHRSPATNLGTGGGTGPGLVTSRAILENGLVVVAVERRKLPIFHADLIVMAGSAYEAEEKAGTANLTANLLSKGTTGRTATEIAEEIDYTGGSIDVSCGRVTTVGSAQVLSEHAPLAMDLLKDMFVHPGFADEELARQKARIVSEITRGKEEPFQVVSDAFQEMVYSGSSLERPVAGYENTLRGIERKDVVGFHEKYYLPNNSVLVVVTDRSASDIIEMSKQYFGSWERRELEAPPVTAPESAAGKSVRLIDMDVNQSYIALGNLGLKRSDADYNAVVVMNYILGGGGFVSRIMKSIRARQGLAYSAYSYFVPGPYYRGYFRAGLQTKLGSTSQAVNSLLAEIRRIREELVTEEELEDAKSYFEGSLPRRQETYGQIADLFVDKEIYGLTEDYWVKDLEEIRSLSREDIRRVAEKYLDPENYVLAIATNVDSLTLEVEGITQDMIEISVP